MLLDLVDYSRVYNPMANTSQIYILQLCNVPSAQKIISQLRHLKLPDLATSRERHCRRYAILSEPEHMRWRFMTSQLSSAPFLQLSVRGALRLGAVAGKL